MNKDCFLTIIIPVYNVKKYLARCFDSIAEQLTSEIEVLVVDDGSTDGSGEICDSYLSHGFKVFHKPNGGQSSARNLALDNAKGKYVLFVDSDDYILPGSLDRIINILKVQNCDVMEIFTDDITEEAISKIPDGIYGGVQFYKLAKKANQIRIGPVFFCIDISYINSLGLRFPEGIIYEDNYWSVLAVLCAKRLYKSSIKYYHRELNPDSTTRRRDNFQFRADSLRRVSKELIDATQRLEVDRQFVYEHAMSQFFFSFAFETSARIERFEFYTLRELLKYTTKHNAYKLALFLISPRLFRILLQKKVKLI